VVDVLDARWVMPGVMLLPVMTILKKSLLYLVAGFIAQLVMFFVVMGLIGAGVIIEWLWMLLLPGVKLFWAEGIHSTNALLGLPLALVFNTFVYATAIFALHSLFKSIRREMLSNAGEA
jgi:hypothetical protein